MYNAWEFPPSTSHGHVHAYMTTSRIKLYVIASLHFHLILKSQEKNDKPRFPSDLTRWYCLSAWKRSLNSRFIEKPLFFFIAESTKPLPLHFFLPEQQFVGSFIHLPMLSCFSRVLFWSLVALLFTEVINLSETPTECVLRQDEVSSISFVESHRPEYSNILWKVAFIEQTCVSKCTYSNLIIWLVHRHVTINSIL